jgi:hypothetical protein
MIKCGKVALNHQYMSKELLHSIYRHGEAYKEVYRCNDLDKQKVICIFDAWQKKWFLDNVNYSSINSAIYGYLSSKLNKTRN